MNKKNSTLIVQDIPVEIVRKRVRNFNLRIYPPDGRVRITLPAGIDDESVRLLVVKKMDWIRKKQTMFQRQVRQPLYEMISGEIHDYRGKSYPLKIIEHSAPPKVWIDGNDMLEMRVRSGTDRGKRLRILEEWYRYQLKQQVPELITRWEKVIGVPVKEWGIKKMKTRWGTCNIKAGRIWLNLELAKKPQKCLEYIVVHEMTHLLERYHNARFYRFMDSWMPDWRDYRDILNRSSLFHE